MSKLAWYVVIMLAIDILLYIARFGVVIIKSAKKDDGPAAGSVPQNASVSSYASANPPSA